MLAKIFKFQENETTLSRELLGGVTTFVTMAYIVIVAPQMLSQANMGISEVFVVVALISAFACILSGLLSNLPFAMAPGLGLLSFFSYVVVQKLGFSYSAGLAAVFISGLLFFLITVTRIRQLILEGIPHSLGCAIAAGIGFFIGLIALRNVHLIVSSKATLVTLGVVDSPACLLFFVGFLLIAILDRKNIPGSILIGMVVVSAIGMVSGVSPFKGVVALPDTNHIIFAHFDFHAITQKAAWPVIFTFLIVALFDSTGTMLGLSHQMGVDKPPIQRINRALLAESVSTTIGAVAGSSTITAYVESASGIRSGGRTGLTAVVVGCLFLLALFFSPLASSVPAYATASGLFYVSCMMIKPFAKVQWEDPPEFIPAVITLLMIPLTFSIADGVGFGVICYCILKTAAGKIKEIKPILWALMLLFIVYFTW